MRRERLSFGAWDFRKCQEHGEYQRALGRLMRDLKGKDKMAEESRRYKKG